MTVLGYRARFPAYQLSAFLQSLRFAMGVGNTIIDIVSPGGSPEMTATLRRR